MFLLLLLVCTCNDEAAHRITRTSCERRITLKDCPVHAHRLLHLFTPTAAVMTRKWPDTTPKRWDLATQTPELQDTNKHRQASLLGKSKATSRKAHASQATNLSTSATELRGRPGPVLLCNQRNPINLPAWRYKQPPLSFPPAPGIPWRLAIFGCLPAG